MHVVGPELQGHLARLFGRPGTVGVDHDLHVGACRLPRGAYFGDLRLVQFDVPIALLDREFGTRRDALRVLVLQEAGVGRQRRLPRSAQQPVQRQVGRLARDVPQRDVETRQREHGDAIAAEQVQFLLQVARKPGDVSGIPANRQRRHHRVDRALYRVGAVVAERVAPARDAVVGLHLDHQDIVGRSGARRDAACRLTEGEGHLDVDGFYFRDLHAAFPFSLTAASNCSA